MTKLKYLFLSFLVAIVANASANRTITADAITKADNTAFILSLSNGGSGQTTANDALNAFLPVQTGFNGYFLQTDGTNTSWVAGGGGGIANVVDDTSPQLGGALDANGFDITMGLNKITGMGDATASGDGVHFGQVMIGDSGSGGTRGLVPDPASGDAQKFLRGDATYAHPAEENIVRIASVIQNTDTTTSGNGRTYLVDTSVSAKTITFPQCGGLSAPAGTKNIIKNRVGGIAPVKVVPNIADTIDGKTVDYVDVSYSKEYQCNASLGEWNEINNRAVGGAHVVTAWTSFTPTGTFTTNSTYTGKYRRVGEMMEVQTKIAFAGAPNSTGLTINIPSGFTIDTAKLTDATSGNLPVGSGGFLDSAAAMYPLFVTYNNSTSIYISAMNTTATYAVANQATQALPFSVGSGDLINVEYRVPIVGWIAQTAVSADQTDYSGLTYALTSSNTQGFGTPTSASCTHDRVGGNLLMECKLTTGTVTASEARIVLPNGLSVADTTRLASIKSCGTHFAGTGSPAAKGGIILCEPSATYIAFSTRDVFNSTSTNPLTKVNGNDYPSSAIISLSAVIPIQGWTSSQRTPSLLGGMTTNRNDSSRIEYTTAVCSPSSSVTSGDFLSAPSNISSGVCTYTMSAGWSVAPKCFISRSSTTLSEAFWTIKATSSTALTVTCSAGGSGCTGGGEINIQCIGAR